MDLREKFSGLVFVFLAIGAGALSARVGQPRDSSPEGKNRASIDRIKGTEPYTELAPLAQQTPPTPPCPADRKTKRKTLSAQQLATQALRFTVSLRGSGIYGAGAVIDSRGYILTSHHVVEDMDKIHVTFFDGRRAIAERIASDPNLDLALLRVDLAQIHSAPIGTATELSIGDTIYSVGSPRKMDFTLAKGMVSFSGRAMDDAYFIQTDLSVNGGSSGGPIVDDQSRIVGVMTFKLRESHALSFALPIDYALDRFSQHLHPSTTSIQRFHSWISKLKGNERRRTTFAEAKHRSP